MNTNQSVILRPCPFCGGEAKLGEANWTGIPKVECINYGKWIEGKWHPELGCKVRPSTYTGSDFARGHYAGKSEAQIVQEVVAAWTGDRQDS